METEKQKKKKRKFVKKSLHNVIVPSPKPFGIQFLQIVLTEEGLVSFLITFLTLCHILWKPFEKEARETNYQSHLVKAQEKNKKRNPTWLKLLSAMNSSSQTVFLGTLGLHRGMPWGKQVGFRLPTHSLLRATSLPSPGALWRKSSLQKQL